MIQAVSGTKKNKQQSLLTAKYNLSTGWFVAVGAFIALFFSLLAIQQVNSLPKAPIVIQNHHTLSPEQNSALKQVLGTQADSNFFQTDLTAYLDKTQQISWVGQVKVQRDWQQGIVIDVVPRQAVARFGTEKLIDASGTVFTPASSKELTAQNWVRLQGDADKAKLIMQQSQQVSRWFQPLGIQVKEIILTPRMTWLFCFDNGLWVLVDKENTAEKLYQLSFLLQNQLSNEFSQIHKVDLRYKNGMAITWRNNTVSAVQPLYQ